MGVREWLGLGATPAPPAPPPAAADRLAAATDAGRRLGRSFAGGRLTLDNPDQFGAFTAFVVPPPDPESRWYLAALDTKTLARTNPTVLMERLVSLSPDVSKAHWDLLRFCNPGYEVQALRPGTETVDPRATAAVQGFMGRLTALYGTPDIPINRLYTGCFLRGAMLAEVVLDKPGRLAIDLATPDPATVRFQKVTDPVRGIVYQLAQYQGAQLQLLERPTIRYLPLDPLPGSPYGRPMVAPALFSTLFLLSLLHDLKRVVQQQGYPRLDISILLEKLQASMPAAAKTDPTVWQQWVQGVTDQVKGVYESLQPDDAYIHGDVIQVNRPVGTVDASSLGAVDGLIRSLERWSARGLKTLPFLMGLSESQTETQATRQWVAHMAGIKSIQHYAENLLGYLFEIALQAEGMQAEVEFRFAELRQSEAYLMAQTEQLEIRNAREKYAAGWTSQDETAQAVVGHDADVPEPRYLQPREVPDPENPNSALVPAGAPPVTTNGRGNGRS